MNQLNPFSLLIFLISIIACNNSRSKNKVSSNENFDNSILTDEIISKTLRQEFEKDINYMLNPDGSDVECLNGIAKAKYDIGLDNVTLTDRVFYLNGSAQRIESNLIKLCNNENITFKSTVPHCTPELVQYDKCYDAYMANYVINKHGEYFINKLISLADSIYLKNVELNNLAVQYWDCDERPRLPNEKERTSDYLPNLIISEVDIKTIEGDFPIWPFMDLGFIIEKDSSLSNFYIRSFVTEFDTNKKFKEELFILAKEYVLSKFPKWIPGKIDGVNVRTNSNVRISFSKKE